MSRLHRSLGFLLKALLGLVAAGLLALGTCALLPRSTSALPESDSIAEIQRVSLGGFEQTLLVRGHRRDAPILLYVHGGPGSAQLPAAPRYSTQLEKHFVVVHWDQRGAGASCSGVDWKTVTLEQIVRDTVELSEKLRKGRKIGIIGHSWGSLVAILAAQRRPDLYFAYVGTGQLVHRDRQEELSYNWTVDRARRAGNRKALQELASIRPPYTKQSQFKLQRKWLGEYHGEIYNTSNARGFLPAAVFGREYTLTDRLNYQKCFERSLETLLHDRLHIDLFSTVPSLSVPAFFFTGRQDYNTAWALVEEYAGKLRAPRVEMVWFAEGGHFLVVETPDEFQARMIEKILPLAAPKK